AVCVFVFDFFFQAEDGIRDFHVTGVQTCALPIYKGEAPVTRAEREAAQAAQRAAGGQRRERPGRRRRGGGGGGGGQQQAEKATAQATEASKAEKSGNEES